MAMAVCPVCKVDSVKKRLTLRGLLHGMLCFPCGIYCCMKSRVWFCPLCTNEVKVIVRGISIRGGSKDDHEQSTPASRTTVSCGRTISGGSESINSTTLILKH
uniref:Bm6065 n=2 Tax=Brugia TaxID=6278 RepID=A0A1I9GE28_BRUMA|nr:Bm6065 [Brugia malayi]